MIQNDAHRLCCIVYAINNSKIKRRKDFIAVHMNMVEHRDEENGMQNRCALVLYRINYCKENIVKKRLWKKIVKEIIQRFHFECTLFKHGRTSIYKPRKPILLHLLRLISGSKSSDCGKL